MFGSEFGQLAGFAGLAVLAAGEAPQADSVAQYGPWAVAFVMVLIFGKEIILKALGKDPSPPKPAGDDALRSLASALEKLTMVLERMERDSEKGHEEILAQLHEIAKTVQGTDYRAKEIRDLLFKAEATMRRE